MLILLAKRLHHKIRQAILKIRVVLYWLLSLHVSFVLMHKDSKNWRIELKLRQQFSRFWFLQTYIASTIALIALNVLCSEINRLWHPGKHTLYFSSLTVTNKNKFITVWNLPKLFGEFLKIATFTKPFLILF
jgi:hypothetical protein